MSIKLFFCLLLSLISAILNPISAMVTGTAPKAKSEAELLEMADYFKDIPLADEIAVVNPWAFNDDERSVIMCLQGLVAQTEASILLNYNSNEAADLEATGCTLLYKDKDGANWTLERLINRYYSHIKDAGYVLFKDVATTEQINMAFNMASVFGYLAVPVSCEAIIKACSLEKREDLSVKDIGFAYQLDFYDRYNERFHDNALVHLANFSDCSLRDFAVREKIFITYTNDDDTLGTAFRDHILKNLKPCSIIMGWCQYEVAFTEAISSFGHYVVPSDWSHNISILNSLPSIKTELADEINAPELNPNKHYAAIVISDGDNAQWIANGFSTFYDWKKLENETPVTFTFAPLMNEFSPTAVRMAVENKGNSSFISGPSGIGYARISKMSPSELEAFSDATASAMLKSGLKTLTILDKPNAVEEMHIENKLKYFACYDNIQGGVFQYDPDRYASGKGKVYFANEKPFITIRNSLWHPSNTYEGVTNEWLKEQAEIVNSYPADIYSINGYSVINVHVWSVTAENLAYFISCLDEDVEIISADELVAAVGANVPHKTASPN